MNKTAARVFDILQMVANSATPLSMADIRKELDLPKSSTSDLVNSLVELEVLGFNADDANSLEPGIRFFELASKFVNNNRLLPVARNNMAALVRDTGQSAFLTVFDGSRVMFLEKIDPPGRLQSHYSPGEIVPLHASASGKAVLATKDERTVRQLLGTEPLEKFSSKTITSFAPLFTDLEASRARKYTIENKERDDYLIAVGAPIRQYDGNVIAAVSSVNAGDSNAGDRVNEVGPLIYATAMRISRFLGYTSKDTFEQAKAF